MLKSSLILAFGGLWLAGCSGGVDGNGQREEEARQVQAFSKVSTDCELDVDVTQGDEASLVVSIDSNLQHLVNTRVYRGVLHIDLDENVDDIVDGPHVRVTVPRLEAARLDGSGNLYVAFEQPEQALDLYLSGSGNVRFEGRAAAVGAYLGGSGDIRLAGEASDVDFALSGSGSIDGAGLAAHSGNVELSGSGDISANVSESVRVSLSGSGEIELYGDGQVDEVRKSGSGEIVRH
jgi:hypothetical protein